MERSFVNPTVHQFDTTVRCFSTIFTKSHHYNYPEPDKYSTHTRTSLFIYNTPEYYPSIFAYYLSGLLLSASQTKILHPFLIYSISSAFIWLSKGYYTRARSMELRTWPLHFSSTSCNLVPLE